MTAHRWTFGTGAMATVFACWMAGAGVAAVSGQRAAACASMHTSPTVLFICPHGAAKSVLASAYFQRLAGERGLNVRVVSAGTDPDATVAPSVAQHLATHGYAIPIDEPRRVTASDVADADVVISIGCDLADVPGPHEKVIAWDDVPALSDDFHRADEKIRERVLQLIDELLRKQGR